MMLSLITGLRQGDVLDLTMRSITADGLLVTPAKTYKKTGQTMLFRWTPELRRAVDDARAIKQPIRGLHLLCNRWGQRYTPGGFQAMWKRAVKKAGVQGFRFHDIRRKSGSDQSNGRAFGTLGQARA